MKKSKRNTTRKSYAIGGKKHVAELKRKIEESKLSRKASSKPPVESHTKAPSGRSKPAKAHEPAIQTAKKSKASSAPYGAEFERWKNGTQLSTLATELKVKRSKLRRAFQQHAGGKDAFKKLRTEGAGGTTLPFGGKRSAGRTKIDIAIDDSKVPVLKSSDVKLKINQRVLDHLDLMRVDLDDRLQNATASEALRLDTGHENAKRIVAQAKTDAKSNGWRVEHYSTHFGTALRLIAPDGKAYVKATATERADYIVESSTGRTRFKIESEARMAKAEAKQQEEVEKGKKALERSRERKRASKKARKGGRR